MDHTQKQTHRLLQKFALTAQMRHSIKILGMSLTDLNDYIDTVISTNPLLEKEIHKDSPIKTNLHIPKRNRALHNTLEDNDIEQEVLPQEDLLFHIRTLDLNEEELEIAEYLISEINEDGYIKIESEEAAHDLCVDIEEIEKIINIIQSLDPPGIGARDLRECLQIQLDRQGRKDSLEYKIVTECLNLLAVQDTISISKVLGIDRKKVLAAVDNIKALNPRPGSTIFGKSAKPVVPDLIATVKNKKIRLEINRGSTPKLRLYDPYTNSMDIIKNEETKEFLQKHTKEATQLLDNIKRREETLCRVAYHILEVQRGNIENKKTYMKVLSVQDLSEALDLNASTISRATSNKYIEINGKVMPLRNLIGTGLKNSSGEETSKTYIKSVLHKLVEEEDKTSPLSDADIMKKLEEKGIGIKRRTVAKYRESINVLPTYLRKKVHK